MISLLIADDHALVREGLRRILETEHGFKVVGEAATGLEAVEKTEREKPDILLLDLTLPTLHGLDILARLKRQHQTKVLIVSMHADEPSVIQAFSLGAKGFLLKESPARQLITAIRTIYEGGCFVSPSLEAVVRRAATTHMVAAPLKKSTDLTRREVLVLQNVASGKSSSDIAIRLGISISTVAKHRANLMRKIGAHSQADIIFYALRHKLCAL